jgi:phosphatidylglycerophosphatase C
VAETESAGIAHGPGMAVFDLDGTISRHDTFLPFLVGYLRRHPSRWKSAPRLATAVGLHAAGRIDNSALKTTFLTAILAGETNETLSAWTTTFLQHLTGAGLRKDGLATLAAHRAAGWTTVLATASPDLYVTPLAAELGFDAAIPTRLERNPDGYLTGRLDAGNCYGAEKAARVAEWRQRHAASGPLWVYTDHHADLPLLDMADRRVGVCASTRLRKAAADHSVSLVEWH